MEENIHGFGNEILRGVEVENGSILVSENNVGVTVFDHNDPYYYNKVKTQMQLREGKNNNGIILVDTAI